MLPSLPLDVTGKQIREGDTVVFPSNDGCGLIFSKVFKITDCFVHMRDEHFGREWIYKRSFRNVYIVKGKEE